MSGGEVPDARTTHRKPAARAGSPPRRELPLTGESDGRPERVREGSRRSHARPLLATVPAGVGLRSGSALSVNVTSSPNGGRRRRVGRAEVPSGSRWMAAACRMGNSVAQPAGAHPSAGRLHGLAERLRTGGSYRPGTGTTALQPGGRCNECAYGMLTAKEHTHGKVFEGSKNYIIFNILF